MRSHVGGNRVADLGGSAKALRDNQGNDGLRIGVLGLALLPFLDGPSGFANVVDGITKFAENALIHRSGAHFVFDADQIGADFLELKAGAPEGFTGNRQLDRDTDEAPFWASARSDHPRVSRLAGNKICELDLSADGRIVLHFQQAAVGVHFRSFCFFAEELAIRFLPSGLDNGLKGETATAPFGGRGRRLICVDG